MSIGDDKEFAEALLKQTTELLGKSLVSVNGEIKEDRIKIAALKKEVNSLRGENKKLREKVQSLEEGIGKQHEGTIEQLEKRVKALEDQKCNCDVTDQLTRAFTAAVTAINIPNVDKTLNAFSVSSPASAFLASTPISTGKQPSMPLLSPHPNLSASQSKKRKSMPKTCTSTFIMDLENVDDSIKESLRPFYFPNPRAANDLLNMLQRAFVKYHAKILMDTGESITKALVKRIIEEGTTQQIWDHEFNPSDTESFDGYLINRLKNERRILRHQAVLDTQNDMLNEYLSTAANAESEDTMS